MSVTSSKTRILSWIGDLPHPVDQDENIDPRSSNTRAIKRRRVASPVCTDRQLSNQTSTGVQTRARVRKALMPRNNSTHQRGRGRGMRAIQPLNPLPIQPPQEAPQETRAEEAVYEDVDVDATPRNKRSGNKRAHLDETMSTDSSSPSKRSRSSVSDVSRSGSPTKRHYITTLPNPIRKGRLDSKIFTDITQKLVENLRSLSSGRGTMKDELRAQLAHSFPYDEGLQLGSHCHYDTDSTRAGLGDDLTLREVEGICREARGCEDREEYEGAWNSFVHAPVLSLARSLSHHRNNVGFTSVTIARPNKTYLPTVNPKEFPLEGKVVDFVMFLEPSETTKAHLRYQAYTPNYGHDYNHTLHAPIANRPIVMSMETKRKGEGFQTGQLQLQIWAAAHLERLQEMADPDPDPDPDPSGEKPTTTTATRTSPPALPVLLTQGPNWTISFAHRENHDHESVTTIYDDIELGNVTKPSGVCKVVACLLQLMDWAQMEYRPWLEKAITDKRRNQDASGSS